MLVKTKENLGTNGLESVVLVSQQTARDVCVMGDGINR